MIVVARSFKPAKIGMVCKGNKIVEVGQGSQASNAGVSPGWIILTLNGKSVPNNDFQIAESILKLVANQSSIEIDFQVPETFSLTALGTQVEPTKFSQKRPQLKGQLNGENSPAYFYYTAAQRAASAAAARKRKDYKFSLKNTPSTNSEIRVDPTKEKKIQNHNENLVESWHRQHTIDNRSFSPTSRRKRMAHIQSRQQNSLSTTDQILENFVGLSKTILSSNKKRISAAVAHRQLKSELSSSTNGTSNANNNNDNNDSETMRKMEIALEMRNRERKKWDSSISSVADIRKLVSPLNISMKKSKRSNVSNIDSFIKNLGDRKATFDPNDKSNNNKSSKIGLKNHSRNGLRPFTPSLSRWPSIYTPPPSRGQNIHGDNGFSLLDITEGSSHDTQDSLHSSEDSSHCTEDSSQSREEQLVHRNGPMSKWLDIYENEEEKALWYSWLNDWHFVRKQHNSHELFLMVKLAELKQRTLDYPSPNKMLVSGVVQLLSCSERRLCGVLGTGRGTGVPIWGLALAEVISAIFKGMTRGAGGDSALLDEATDYHYSGDGRSSNKDIQIKKSINDNGADESKDSILLQSFSDGVLANGMRRKMEVADNSVKTTLQGILSGYDKQKNLLIRPPVFTALRGSIQTTLDSKQAFWSGDVSIKNRQQLCRALAQALIDIPRGNQRKQVPTEIINELDIAQRWGDELYLGADIESRWNNLRGFRVIFDEVPKLIKKFEKEKKLRVLLQGKLERRKNVQVVERRGINRLASNNMRATLCFWFMMWKKYIFVKKNTSGVGTHLRSVKERNLMHKMFHAILHHLRVKICNDALDYQNKLISQKSIIKKRTEKYNQTAKESQRQIDNMIEERDRLRIEVEEALEILNRPERQPVRLAANLAGLSDANVPMIRQLQFENHLRLKEIRRDGAGTKRLAPLYRYYRPGSEKEGQRVSDSDDEECESDFDEDIEETIRAWKPGLPAARKAVQEITPAFRPFSTRPGRRLIRWVNYHIFESGYTLGQSVQTPCIDENDENTRRKLKSGQVSASPITDRNDRLLGGGDLVDGQALSIIVEQTLKAIEISKIQKNKNIEYRKRLERVRKAKIKFDEEQESRQVRRRAMWLELAKRATAVRPNRRKYYWEKNPQHSHTKAAMKIQRQYRGQRSRHAVYLLRLRTKFESTSEYKLRSAFAPLERLRACRDDLQEKLGCGRFLDNMRRLTGENEPPTEEEKKIMAARLERLAQREKETGILVHIVSKYMGMRVHIEMDQEPYWFCLFAQLFFLRSGIKHFIDPVATKCMRRIIKEFKDVQDLFTTFWTGDFAECYPKHFFHYNWATGEIHAPLDFTGEEILSKAENFHKQFDTYQKSTIRLSERFAFCLKDRRDYETTRNDILRHGWQSLCTTLLSRRTRTEEDLDDGTYTTVDIAQLGTLFKRLNMENDTEGQLAECKNVSLVLKKRIRDLKRIFAFYCASGDDGDATTMDSSEYWKFVKECKLQSNRKLLPSVRVDIVFQQADQDLSKTGKERIESAEGEFEAPKWIEVIVRLASYRYRSGTLAERVEKMLNEDILPNACSLDLDVFRDRVSSEQVQEVLNRHRKYNKPIFDVYAADDDSDAAIDALGTMNVKEMVTFCSEMQLIGVRFGQRSCRTLFAYCQQEEEELEEDEDDSGESEMVYGEFCEVLIAISCYMRCDPYVVVEIRLKEFLNECIYPVAIKMDRFRKILKWKPQTKKVLSAKQEAKLKKK